MVHIKIKHVLPKLQKQKSSAWDGKLKKQHSPLGIARKGVFFSQLPCNPLKRYCFVGFRFQAAFCVSQINSSIDLRSFVLRLIQRKTSSMDDDIGLMIQHVSRYPLSYHNLVVQHSFNNTQSHQGEGGEANHQQLTN